MAFLTVNLRPVGLVAAAARGAPGAQPVDGCEGIRGKLFETEGMVGFATEGAVEELLLSCAAAEVADGGHGERLRSHQAEAAPAYLVRVVVLPEVDGNCVLRLGGRLFAALG